MAARSPRRQCDNARVDSPDLPPRALQILQTVFGYAAFREQQAEVVAHVAGGGNALVLMPTGGGKSLCFQVPALLRDGIGIVISPLIALMQDQVAALQRSRRARRVPQFHARLARPCRPSRSGRGRVSSTCCTSPQSGC